VIAYLYFGMEVYVLVAAMGTLGLSTAAPTRHVVAQDDVNVCTDAKLRSNASGIVFLGSFPSHSECAAATLALPESTAYWYADKDCSHHWALGCYARTDGLYKPKHQKHCSSGRVVADGPPPPHPPPPSPAPEKHCPDNCSLNGICTGNGECQCDPAWVGESCQTLAILPGARDSGFRQINIPPGGPNGTLAGNTSTWGGAVLYDPKYKLWFMWATELTAHCAFCPASALVLVPWPDSRWSRTLRLLFCQQVGCTRGRRKATPFVHRRALRLDLTLERQSSKH
jgi:hypothetical protein